MQQHLLKAFPIAAFLLRPPVKPFIHDPTGLPIELFQHIVVSADTVIIPVPEKLLAQLFEQICRA